MQQAALVIPCHDCYLRTMTCYRLLCCNSCLHELEGINLAYLTILTVVTTWSRHEAVLTARQILHGDCINEVRVQLFCADGFTCVP
jgi:hypothetical protein